MKKYSEGKHMGFCALRLLVCFAVLLTCSLPALATGTEISTDVMLVAIPVEITGQTEDFAMAPGSSQTLKITVSQEEGIDYLWERSSDGGAGWETVGTARDYTVTNARLNTPATQPYLYRVTAAGQNGTSDTALIRVLVAEDYSYRTIRLREGLVDTSAYMHKNTRLTLQALSDGEADALALEAGLAPGCAGLLLCRPVLTNRDESVVPYFGRVTLDFTVGAAYNGRTLRVLTLADGEVRYTAGSVADGVLMVETDALSPCLVEVPSSDVYTITARAGACGSIVPAGDVSVTAGTSQTFTFLPEDGCRVSQVLVNGVPQTITGNSYTFTDLSADGTITVSFQKMSASKVLCGITVTAGPHGSVSPTGSLRGMVDSPQTFYFYPDAGYELDTVLVNGTAVQVLGDSYTLPALEGDTLVEVTFREAATQLPDVYLQITASAGLGGAVSPAGTVSVEYGGDMFYYFIPDTGYTVDRVLVDGAAVSAGTFYRFGDVTQNHTLRVTFRSIQPKVYYTITAEGGEHGSVSPTGKQYVVEGGSQTFTLLPDEGYEVDTLTVDGEIVDNPGTVYTFRNVTGGHTLRATFWETAAAPETVYYTFTVTAGEHGTVSPRGENRTAAGERPVVYFFPDEGYMVDTLLVNGEEVSFTGDSWTLSAMEGDAEILVTFCAIPPETVYHTVEATWGEGGSVSPGAPLQVADGGSQTFYFLPDEGYTVESVTFNGVRLDITSNQYTVENITGDTEIRVTFRLADTGLHCHCLWYRLFGRCLICGWFGVCIEPWCWLVPLLAVLAVPALWIVLRRNRKKDKKKQNQPETGG